ncbi:MAG: TadE family protein [Anaerolineales bacterium]
MIGIKKIFQIKDKHPRAQAMVEFMLVMPILIILLYGIIEFSRLIFIFASVSNASRQAARYGAGAGEVNDGTTFYQDCEGIREAANESAILVEFEDINITYDRGLTKNGEQIPIANIDPNPNTDTCPIEDNLIQNGDRIIVQVTAHYEPIIKILPLEPLTIVSANARTFLISIPIFGSAAPTGFKAESPTPSRIPSNATATQTFPPTFTKVPPISGTQGFKTPLSTLSPTLTLTPSLTPPPTWTSSVTPTFISCTGVTNVSHSGLEFEDNAMSMNIVNNTGHRLTTAQVYVEWNHNNGHNGNDPTLRLTQIQFTGQAPWNGDIFAPSAFIPAYYPTIPTGSSTIKFVFHQTYTVFDGTERIIITIGTPGCVNYPIDSSN